MECKLARRRFFPSLTTGERRFVWALGGTCILGAILACVAVLRLHQAYPSSEHQLVYTSWTAVAGFVGAAGGFYSCYARWLGHPGPRGWISAVIGAVLVSGIGSVVAGSLILPIYGTMFGPLQLMTTMIAYPLLGVVWFGMLICAHGLLVPWRSERESIFARRAA